MVDLVSQKVGVEHLINDFGGHSNGLRALLTPTFLVLSARGPFVKQERMESKLNARQRTLLGKRKPTGKVHGGGPPKRNKLTDFEGEAPAKFAFVEN